MPDMYKHLKAELAERHPIGGVAPSTLLSLPAEQAQPLQLLIKFGALTADQLAERLRRPPDKLQATLDELVAKGMATVDAETEPPQYRVVLAHRPAKVKPSGLWLSLVDKLQK